MQRETTATNNSLATLAAGGVYHSEAAGGVYPRLTKLEQSTLKELIISGASLDYAASLLNRPSYSLKPDYLKAKREVKLARLELIKSICEKLNKEKTE